MPKPQVACDFYKTGHIFQYPKSTEEVYSNFTPRSDKYAPKGVKEVVNFGLQSFIIDYLIQDWDDNFFENDCDTVLASYKRRMDTALGKDAVSVDHIEALHNLGYLPILIKSLPEGASVPFGVPLLTIVNTLPEFFWLTNYLESVMSCELWKPITTATIAKQYKKILTEYAVETGTPLEFIPFQAHDFSFRGMSGRADAAICGLGHLTSFWGTDTIPAIELAEDVYYANAEKEPVGFSVAATEHSVMCMGTKEAEIETFRRLITEIYPSGIVSIVSDTWDFWKVLTEYLPALKDIIMARESNGLQPGKVVIRPDSGDPVKIICGDWGSKDENIYKGAVELLWDTFGGIITSTGHKLLDGHIGLIYGDSITLERAEEILRQLDMKGFASGNIVFGIGSYTYQMISRDTLGLAMKATHGIVAGEGREIYKDPVTDDGSKKSARGYLKVIKEEGKYKLLDCQTKAEEEQGELTPVFKDGCLLRNTTLAEIRKLVG